MMGDTMHIVQEEYNDQKVNYELIKEGILKECYLDLYFMDILETLFYFQTLLWYND